MSNNYISDDYMNTAVILTYKGYTVYKSLKTNFIAIYDKNKILRKYMPMRSTLTLDVIKTIIDNYLDKKEILKREAEDTISY